MAGWHELNKNEKGQYWFTLKAGNVEIILRSEQYESKASAENGIASVQANSPLENATSARRLLTVEPTSTARLATTKSLAPARCTKLRQAGITASSRSKQKGRAQLAKLLASCSLSTDRSGPEEHQTPPR
jgi:uncharacterized protein YegP (UPF0339 family)